MLTKVGFLSQESRYCRVYEIPELASKLSVISSVVGMNIARARALKPLCRSVPLACSGRLDVPSLSGSFAASLLAGSSRLLGFSDSTGTWFVLASSGASVKRAGSLRTTPAPLATTTTYFRRPGAERFAGKVNRWFLQECPCH